MCGLLLTNIEKSINELNSALLVMSNRGPDSYGYMLYNNLYFGHTRLSITGINGKQPFYITDSIICIVNGEFYNYLEIKRSLELSGYVFKTDSDSEILLYLYLKYGMKCLDYLNGEFSFILYDIKKNVIYSCRDRFGSKPLYFYLKDKNFIFTSSLDVIKQLIGTFEIDEQSLNFVQTLQYLPQTKTLFKNINQIKPAHFIEYKLYDNTINEISYWSRPNFNSEIVADIEYVRYLVIESIKSRIPNLPYSCHLSGGIDSTIINIIANNIKPTTAFSVDFDQEFYSEYKCAEKTANEYGINLIKVNVSLDDIFNNLEKAIYNSNGISINGHIVAKYLLNKTINEYGFKVSLSGEGSDEIFYGYSHFNQITNFNKQYLTGIQLPDNNTLDTSYIKQKLGYVPTWINAKSSIGYKIHNFAKLKNHEDAYQLFVKEYLNSTNINTNNKLLLSSDTWCKYALNDYLLKTLDDSMSMNFSIEGRIPYLDLNLVNYISQLNTNLNFDDFGGKSLLRNAFGDILPKHIINKPKQSFMSPTITNLFENTKHKKYFTDLIVNSKISNYYDIDKLVNFINISNNYTNEPPIMILLSLSILSNKFL